ncbi:hypothetical protein RAC89_23895 [Paenibacillus sp. GD4]|uniref:hypothetical protein n=1 Tax=Paenibacillus sp. GD4 TaxID=3068890 RepID=UPI002796D71A|nr:hypothetical protein [Paenibacillus sp. GD4]MDQ1913445.1 hypothetical protein [Paenibacillus sp. GD4]
MNQGNWQPGHYVFIGADRITEQYILDNFKGVQKAYQWKDLEPEKGQYDFTEVKKDLEFLGKHGKFLVIQLQYKGFTKGHSIIPAYVKGAEYGGSPLVSKVGALNSVVWNKNVRERIGELIRALGKEFDGNPFLAAINLPETATNYNFNNPQEGIEEYTHAKYVESLKYLMKSLREAFPNTVVIQYTNFPAVVLPELIEYQEEIGVGLGGPDVYPGKIGVSDVNDPERGVYRFYSRLSGKVPLGAAVQSENYADILKKQNAIRRGEQVTILPGDEIPFPVRDHLKLAQEKLHLNYMFWARLPTDSFENVKKLLAEPDVAGDPAGGLDARLPEKTFLK